MKRILTLLTALLLASLAALHAAEPVTKSIGTRPLRILPLGDSITRGSYLAQKNGKATGLPHQMSGGWRKALHRKCCILRRDRCA